MLSTLLFALIIGVCVALVWSALFDTHGPWNSFFWFFVVIFLFTWGGGSWITPFGPTSWGVAWLPFVGMGVFMALLLTATTPRNRRSRTRSTDPAPPVSNAKAKDLVAVGLLVTVDLFFWAFIIVLGVIVLSHLMWSPRLP